MGSKGKEGRSSIILFANIILSLAVILFGVTMIIYVYREYGDVSSQSPYAMFMLMIGFTLIFFAGQALYNMVRFGLEVGIPQLSIITVVKCYSCGLTSERKFQNGDYVNKVVGKCEKCAGVKYISNIYAEEPKKKRF